MVSHSFQVARILVSGLVVLAAAHCGLGAPPNPADQGGPTHGATSWAYQPIERPPVPNVAGDRAAWITNPIDAFILSKLTEHGLAPAPPAEKVALLRRAHYDLTGLSPSPEEVDA